MILYLNVRAKLFDGCQALNRDTDNIRGNVVSSFSELSFFNKLLQLRIYKIVLQAIPKSNK